MRTAVPLVVLIALVAVAFLLLREDRSGGALRPVDDGAATARPEGDGLAPLDDDSDRSARASAGAAEPIAPGSRDGAASAAPALDSSPARLRLVDARTGAPVPGLAVELRSEGAAHEGVTSGAEGLVQGEVPRHAGPLVVDLSEAFHANDMIQTWRARAAAVPRSATVVHVPGAAEPVRVEVARGPRLELDVSPPPGLHLEDLAVTLRAEDPGLAFDRLHSRVRTDGPDGPAALPWVRFSALAYVAGGGPPWRLWLESDDGLWGAEVEVGDLDSAAERPLAVRLERRARLRGVVLDVNGAPVARQWVRLEPDDPSMYDWDRRPRVVPTDVEGRFDYRAVPAAEYTLKVEARSHAPLEERLSLEAGVGRMHDVQLAAATDVPPPPADPRDAPTIAGVVRSQSGTFEGDVRVGLRPAGDGVQYRSARVRWEREEGELVGRFEEAVQPGEVFVARLSTGTFHPVTPGDVDVAAGETALEFLVLDGEPRRTVRLHAVDATTGEPVRSPRFRLTSDGVTRYARVEDGVAVVGGLPEPLAFVAEVSAQDYRRAEVTQDDLDPDDPSAVLEVALEPGWSLSATAVGPDDAPLAGVEVLLDGAVAGRTDVEGRVELSAPAVPRTLHARLEGWRAVSNGHVSARTGAFRSWQSFVTLELEPE